MSGTLCPTEYKAAMEPLRTTDLAPAIIRQAQNLIANAVWPKQEDRRPLVNEKLAMDVLFRLNCS